MTLEKIESGSRSGGQPKISLRKSNSIGINSAALSEYFEDATHVNVYYDSEENIIGLEPLEEEEDGSYTLSKVSESGSVTPTSFLKSAGLVPDVTTHYSPYLHDDEEIVLIDLDEPDGTYGDPDGE